MIRWKNEVESLESEGQGEAPQLVVQQFSMEALHHTMINNNCQILAMFDEMSVMYGQLDAYKHSGSRLDRSTLLDLYNGGSWSRNFKNKENSSIKMQQTSFNMCGFIQPSFIVNMQESSDPDAFNDRQFYICPEEVEYKYDELKVPMNESVAKLEDIFRSVKKAHNEKKIYEFDETSHSTFVNLHDELSRRKLAIIDDEDRRGILSKAKGQLARLAMVVHSIEQAIRQISSPTMEWNSTIDEGSLTTAKIIMDYIIEQKFALMLPEVKVSSTVQGLSMQVDTINLGDTILDSNPKYLSKFLSYKEPDVCASDVSRFRLIPPTPTNAKNKYPVELCKSYMRSVSEAGFGTIDESRREGNSRKSFTFHKKPFSELGDKQHETLKRLRLTPLEYDSSQQSNESRIDSFLCQTDSDISSDYERDLLSTPDSAE